MKNNTYGLNVTAALSNMLTIWIYCLVLCKCFENTAKSQTTTKETCWNETWISPNCWNIIASFPPTIMYWFASAVLPKDIGNSE